MFLRIATLLRHLVCALDEGEGAALAPLVCAAAGEHHEDVELRERALQARPRAVCRGFAGLP